MNRELLVTLLRKDIRELDMITEGFMEMKEYPNAIILLAKHKIEDIQQYIKQLSEIKADPACSGIPVSITANNPAQDLEPVASEIDVETSLKITAENKATEPSLPEPELAEMAAPQIVSEPHKTEIVAETTIVKEQTTAPENPVAEQPIRVAPAEKAIIPSRNETMAKVDNSLGSVLANKKIDDIKQGINISDRFRFQRELFKGNGEDMNKTLTYLNQLATLEEALSFLNSKYCWTSENDTQEDFLQIVRRRFL